jgi:hypothetical protein
MQRRSTTVYTEEEEEEQEDEEEIQRRSSAYSESPSRRRRRFDVGRMVVLNTHPALSTMRCPQRSASATTWAKAAQKGPMASAGRARALGAASSTFHMSSETVNTNGERKSS